MKNLSLFASAALAMAISIPAHAQFAKPDDAAKYRQGALTVMAAHFGRVNAMAQGKTPFDAKVAQENIDIAVAVSKLPWAGFSSGGEGASIKNTAKAEIWKDAAKFKEAAEKTQAELVKLQAAVKSNNLDAIKTAAGAVGSSCKSCHDAFRAQ